MVDRLGGIWYIYWGYDNSNRVTSVLFEKDDPADAAKKIHYKDNYEYANDRMIDNFH